MNSAYLIYACIGILVELPLVYFFIPAKERRPELLLLVVIINFITWPLSMSLGMIFPHPILNFLFFMLLGAAEGLALHYAYSRALPKLKMALITGGISLFSFIFVNLLIRI
ncbi:MAG: hypothetical protein MUF42_14170 [Cytophagaceae bacterium]|jgi:hypothetical protein|nr:hypothetical protein [Cytophagaceae bacterium]